MLSTSLVPTIITTVNELSAMASDLYDAGTFAFDTETRAADYAKNPTDGALRKMDMGVDLASFATLDNLWVVPLGMVTVPNIDLPDFVSVIKPLMENPDLLKLGWNCSFDFSAYANLGISVWTYEDLMVMAHLLDDNRSVSLKERCHDVGVELQEYDFKTYWKARHAYQTGAVDRRGVPKVTHEQLAALESAYLTYSGQDAGATALWRPWGLSKLQAEPRLNDLYYGLVNPGVRTIFNMERRGCPIDTAYIKSIAIKCKADLDAAEEAIYQVAGRHFNIGSTKELGKVLYEEMGLPVHKTTDKGAPSTDAGALEALAEGGHKIAEVILRQRHLSKLYGTYVDPEAGLCEQAYSWGSIHCNFNITGTATGRLSSSNPNMQNIPRDSAKTYHIRRSFVPHKGYCLVGGDQSQVELRAMAHFSKDANMLAEYRKDEALWKALNNGDSTKGLNKSDIHQSTADACNCTRGTAKNINFGLLYGMMSKKLAQTLTSVNFKNCLEKGLPFDPLSDIVTPDLAQEFIDGFFGRYPGVRGYQEFISEKAKRQGYIETRFGRKRRLPDVFADDRYLVLAACRQAVNVTIQGHIGEMMLLCMNKAENVIDNPHGRALQKLGFRLFLQVHDEVMGECPDREQTIQDCKYHLTQIFQNPMPSSDAYPYSGYAVPLIFEACSGYNWSEVH